jgi:hypothetical protein
MRSASLRLELTGAFRQTASCPERNEGQRGLPQGILLKIGLCVMSARSLRYVPGFTGDIASVNSLVGETVRRCLS